MHVIRAGKALTHGVGDLVSSESIRCEFQNAFLFHPNRFPIVANQLPNVFKELVAKYPEVAAAHEAMADAVQRTGPLDAKTCALIKIGISVGAGLESAVRSHVRRATQAGATRDEIIQAIFQGMNTVGFPRTVAAWSWALIQFARDDRDDIESGS